MSIENKETLFMMAGVPVVKVIGGRIEKDELVNGLHYYNLRMDEDWEPYILQKHVWADHYGTIATTEAIKLFEDNRENDRFEGYELTEDDVLNLNNYI
ncbi:hypothetical protein MZM54_02790 [[Brevibacterium] frigoritolerans]|nr:hypothetical protein [Peribacillus frigoritolerans]